MTKRTATWDASIESYRLDPSHVLPSAPGTRSSTGIANTREEALAWGYEVIDGPTQPVDLYPEHTKLKGLSWELTIIRQWLENLEAVAGTGVAPLVDPARRNELVLVGLGIDPEKLKQEHEAKQAAEEAYE